MQVIRGVDLKTITQSNYKPSWHGRRHGEFLIPQKGPVEHLSPAVHEHTHHCLLWCLPSFSVPSIILIL